MHQRSFKVVLLLLMFLITLGAGLYAGGSSEADQGYDPLNPPPPEIPEIPEHIPRIIRTIDDQLLIIESYGGFLQSARDLLKDSKQFGLERNAAGIQAFRTVRQQWFVFFTHFTYRPKDDSLTSQDIASFFDGISSLDSDLIQVVEDLNDYIDSQRVLTSEKYQL